LASGIILALSALLIISWFSSGKPPHILKQQTTLPESERPWPAIPKVGDKVGNLEFSKLLNDADMKYLGLDKMAPFTLKDVKADYVLVDAFSTTCPHCLQQAPHLNKLYNLVSQDANMKDKLKFVAAGYQDNDMKLNAWKAIQKVPFP